MHGVHPSANTPPNTNELKVVPGLMPLGTGKLHENWNIGNLNIPVIIRPNRKITAPPPLNKICLHGAKLIPSAANTLPNKMKIAVNPKIKNTAFSTSRRRDTPPTNPKYPGTNGKVHGAKNINIPATKAGIAS